jgi:hypothetical protein
MPMIDLKNCTIRLRDGYTEAGAVNNAAGYAAAAVSMVVDGIVGVIPVGTIFTMANKARNEYIVTSTTETAGNTTTVNFTPWPRGSCR